MGDGRQQRAVVLDHTGARALNREERRAREKAGIEPDEFINLREWIKPEYKKREVTRGEFMAILVHYEKQRRWRRRIKVAVLNSRVCRWFLTKLFGMTIAAPIPELGKEPQP